MEFVSVPGPDPEYHRCYGDPTSFMAPVSAPAPTAASSPSSLNSQGFGFTTTNNRGFIDRLPSSRCRRLLSACRFPEMSRSSPFVRAESRKLDKYRYLWQKDTDPSKSVEYRDSAGSLVCGLSTLRLQRSQIILRYTRVAAQPDYPAPRTTDERTDSSRKPAAHYKTVRNTWRRALSVIGNGPPTQVYSETTVRTSSTACKRRLLDPG